ncbi:MAG: esterase/lipase family protein [Acidimicrobiales bacterium]
MDADRPTSVGPPSRLDLTLEAPRAWAELGGFIAAAPALRSLPRGDGHPVLVLPGFLASDSSTIALRRLLRRLGHRAYGWRLGRNLGPTGAVVDGVERSVVQLSSRHDQPIDLVGWSLGGVYARELGRRHPERVRQVISLGSPFNMTDRRGSHSSDDYDRFAPLHDRDSSFVTGFVPSPEPLPIPSTAIYTRTDGIVAWQTCIQRTDARSENVEVRGSHCGLGHNATVAVVVADRLAQPMGEWRPFRPPHRLRLMYPDAVDGPGTAPKAPNEGDDRWIA